MFSDKKNDNTESSKSSKQQNKLAEGTELIGDITGSGSFRIEGKLEGTLKTAGKVVLGKTGIIDGQLECENADIEGNFSGKIKVKNTLTLKSSAKIDGEVETRRLSIEPGAEFNASCEMKEQVKSLKNENSKKQKREQGQSA